MGSLDGEQVYVDALDHPEVMARCALLYRRIGLQ